MSSYFTASKCPDCGSALVMDDRGREGYFLTCPACEWELSEAEAVEQGYGVQPKEET